MFTALWTAVNKQPAVQEAIVAAEIWPNFATVRITLANALKIRLVPVIFKLTVTVTEMPK